MESQRKQIIKDLRFLEEENSKSIGNINSIFMADSIGVPRGNGGVPMYNPFADKYNPSNKTVIVRLFHTYDEIVEHVNQSSRASMIRVEKMPFDIYFELTKTENVKFHLPMERMLLPYFRRFWLILNFKTKKYIDITMARRLGKSTISFGGVIQGLTKAKDEISHFISLQVSKTKIIVKQLTERDGDKTNPYRVLEDMGVCKLHDRDNTIKFSNNSILIFGSSETTKADTDRGVQSSLVIFDESNFMSKFKENIEIFSTIVSDKEWAQIVSISSFSRFGGQVREYFNRIKSNPSTADLVEEINIRYCKEDLGDMYSEEKDQEYKATMSNARYLEETQNRADTSAGSSIWNGFRNDAEVLGDYSSIKWDDDVIYVINDIGKIKTGLVLARKLNGFMVVTDVFQHEEMRYSTDLDGIIKSRLRKDNVNFIKKNITLVFPHDAKKTDVVNGVSVMDWVIKRSGYDYYAFIKILNQDTWYRAVQEGMMNIKYLSRCKDVINSCFDSISWKTDFDGNIEYPLKMNGLGDKEYSHRFDALKHLILYVLGFVLDNDMINEDEYNKIIR